MSTPSRRFPAASAQFSSCGRHRFVLTRHWSEASALTVVMLNPSTADGQQLDPTTRRVARFARRDGFGGMVVVNLWSYRTPHPRELRAAGWPEHPADDEVVDRALDAPAVVAAWGAFPPIERVRRRLGGRRPRDGWWCWGVTKHGAPRHPLYLPRDAPRRRWSAPW